MVIASTKEIKTTMIPCMLFYSGAEHRTDIEGSGTGIQEKQIWKVLWKNISSGKERWTND